MITKTQIMWTCLPNGVVAGSNPLTLKLSMVVTPQLFSNSTADTIRGTVFQDWPAYVRGLTGATWVDNGVTLGGWTFAFNNPQTLGGATIIDNISPVVTSSLNVDGATLWQSIFSPDTPVLDAGTVSATPQYKVHSYDAGKVALAIRAAHHYAVQSHTNHGKLVLTGSDPYSFLLSEHKKAKAVHHKMVAAVRGMPHGSTHEVLKDIYLAEHGDLDVGYELARHAVFFDPAKYRTDKSDQAVPMAHPMGAGVDGSTGATGFSNDFNSIVAHLGGQPTLQRKLGLILDFTIPVPALLLPHLIPGSTPPSSAQFLWAIPAPPTAMPASYTSLLPANDVPDLTKVLYITPSTKADITQGLFRTALSTANPVTPSSGGSINNGFLPLGDTNQYVVYTEDTEGTPFKLDAAAESTATDLDPKMPALRTAGLSISQGAREAVLMAPTNGLISRQASLAGAWVGGTASPADPNALNVTADDVVRGYAVDIAIGAPGSNLQFQSLCMRDSRVYIPGLAPQGYVVSDEGYTKATTASTQGAATNADGTVANTGDLSLHTSLFGWEGWSLAVQRPGRVITPATPAGDIVQTETPLQPVNSAVTNFPSCQITVRAQTGKLPKLRFGQYYTLRARALDLAGNDMTGPSANVPQFTTGLPGGANPLHSATTQYLRYEPVPNPVLVLQNPLTEGEHIENLVIRSNPWGFLPNTGATPLDPTGYATWATQNLKPMNAYTATCQRWVAPPKGAWGQAEMLGAFDVNYFAPMAALLAADLNTAPGVKGPIVPGMPYTAGNAAQFTALKSALFLCSQKEEGLFTDSLVWDTGNTTATSPSYTNPMAIVTPPSAQNAPPPTAPGQALAPGQYNILQVGPTFPYAILPYLPDANAQGIIFQQLAGIEPAGVSGGTASGNGAPEAKATAGTVVSTATRTYLPRTGRNWPEIDMPQLILQGVPYNPQVFNGGPLPSIAWGSTTGVSGLDPSAPPVSAPGSVPANFSPPASNAPITISLAPGQQLSMHYGSSLANPGMMAASQTGATNVVPYAPYRTITMIHAVQQPKPPNNGQYVNQTNGQVWIQPRNPGDTSVTFVGSFGVDGPTSNGVDMTTSWADYVDTEVSSGVAVATDGSNRRYTVKSGRLASWTLGTTDNVCAFSPTAAAAPSPTSGPSLLQQCGDTKTRQIFIQLTATSRFREFFPASLQSNAANFQNAMPAVPLTAANLLNTSTGIRIPSTARPSVPKILYVVPTFGWSSTSKSGKTTNTRTGRGLRVFVDRPWFTTGDTEMLGVVVNQTGTTAQNVQAYVSQWGLDPIKYPQGQALAQLDSTQLLGGTTYTNVPLLENGAPVTVVAFPPSAFDTTRNLWYFDIEFAASSVEAPFVRLSLMRFQPNSVGGSAAFPNTLTTTPGDLRMSNVVLADMVKLSADRTASYTVATNGSVTVTVSGTVESSESWSGSTGALAANTVNNPASYGRAVYAQIQEAKNVTNPGEFDWTTIGSPVQLLPFQLAGTPGNTTSLSYMTANAQGILTPILKPSVGAGTKHQLLITEYEIFQTDQTVAFPAATLPGSAANPAPTVNNYGPSLTLGGAATSPTNTTSRIVFSDVLPLPY